MKNTLITTLLLLLTAAVSEAHVVRLRIERRETVLNGRPFGAAGPYEKLIGKVDFGLDPTNPRNDIVVDLKLAPKNARGEVEATADFYLLKPVDPRRGNGRLFYEVGNRGGKSILPTFQKAAGSPDPSTEAEFGDGALMRQGFTLLWMGWQWDVPRRPGTMRMEMPIATENGKRITGIVRGNFILNERASTAPLADRNHLAYPVLDPAAAENVMTVRDDPTAKGQIVPRSKWHFVDDQNVALDGGFEPGRIYDVVYRTADPRVLGFSLAGTRDLISFFKHDASPDNPAPGLRHAIGWGCRSAAGSSATSSIRASTPTRRDARSSTASSIKSAARAADRSTTDSVRRHATRCSSSTSFFLSICSRSRTDRRPILRRASPIRCSRAPSARTPCRRCFTC
jgi:hypothetical protein